MKISEYINIHLCIYIYCIYIFILHIYMFILHFLVYIYILHSKNKHTYFDIFKSLYIYILHK